MVNERSERCPKTVGILPLYPPVSLFLPAARNNMNINLRIEPQHSVDNGATQQFFPPASCWLPQHNLRNLSFTGNLHERSGDIATLHSDHLSPQVLGEEGVFFQVFQCCFTLLTCTRTVLEKSDHFAGEGQISLRLDRDGNEIG